MEQENYKTKVKINTVREKNRLYDRLQQKLLAVSPVWGDSIAFVIRLVWLAMLLLVSVALLVSGSYNPFLYFRF